MNFLLLVSIFLFFLNQVHGYIVYCPCMGRFGNQADQFLGTLLFAKGVNRTLVLPPFIEYIEPYGLNLRSFNDMFQLETIRNFHHVITMKEFMETVAPSLWPQGQRKVFCYSHRQEKVNCRVDEGRPFKNFWDHFGIKFDKHVSINMLDTHNPDNWNDIFPPSEFPVLAFGGALGPFPIRENAVPLHRFLTWNASFSAEVDKTITEHLARPYVAIHLRNDLDFSRVCKLLDESGVLFDSAQCHGFNPSVNVTQAQCKPPTELVLAHTRQMLLRTGARALFVATDRDDMEREFRQALGASLQVFQSTTRLDTDFRMDLALLGRADGAVLNCVSSFSAFAGRERGVERRPTEYFGFSPLVKTEL